MSGNNIDNFLFSKTKLQYNYLKPANKYYENKFKNELTKSIKFEEVKNLKNQNYLLTKLKISPKIEDNITKRNNYYMIKKPYDLILEKKKGTLNKIFKN